MIPVDERPTLSHRHEPGESQIGSCTLAALAVCQLGRSDNLLNADIYACLAIKLLLSNQTRIEGSCNTS
jgi:hypothetical protein